MRIGLLGFGTIGSSVYRLIQKEHDQILEGTGVDLQVAKVLEIDPSKGPADAARGAVHHRLRRDRRRSVHRHRGRGHRRHHLGLRLPRRAPCARARTWSRPTSNCWPAAGRPCSTLARDERRHLRFEASVAGAIPIIKVMRESMIAAELHTVYGIVNGTTNYILTRMYDEEGDYAEILAEGPGAGLRRGRPHRRRGRRRRGRQDGHPRLHRLPFARDACRCGLRGHPEHHPGRRPLREGPRVRGQAHRGGPADRRQGERAGVPGSASPRIIRWPRSAGPTTLCSCRATQSARSC